jgi:hypothetical protein
MSIRKKAPVALGTGEPTAGRSTPAMGRSKTTAAAITAPVLPAEEGVGVARLHQARAHGDGRVRLAAHRGGGRLARVDHVGGVHHLDALARRPGWRASSASTDRAVAHQHHREVRPLKQSSDRALDLYGRGTVGAHRVYRDPHLCPGGRFAQNSSTSLRCCFR